MELEIVPFNPLPSSFLRGGREGGREGRKEEAEVRGEVRGEGRGGII
jgi:hypothetical protein